MVYAAVLRGILFVISIFEVWLCYQLIYDLMIEKKYLSLKEKIISGANIVVLGAMLAFNRSYVFYSYTMFGICVIVTSLCVLCIIRKNYILILSIVGLFYAVTAFLDYFFAFFTMIFLKMKFTEIIHRGVSFWKIGVFFGSRIILFIGILFLKQKENKFKNHILEYKIFLRVFCVVVICIVVKYQMIMVEMALGKRPMNGMEGSISILLAMIVLIFGGSVFMKSLILKKENQLLIVREEMLSKNYQDLLNMIEKNRQMVHDIKHHFTVLREYEERGQYEKLREYLGNVDSVFCENSGVPWTGNRILDFLLNKKKAEAEHLGILFDIETSAVFKLPLEDTDVCALMGNVLDNAIEACERMASGSRWVSVHMKKQQDMFFIEVSNSIDKVPVMKHGQFLTKKGDKELHGYGIKSIRRIVDKYDGTIAFQIEDRMFKVNISFF